MGKIGDDRVVRTRFDKGKPTPPILEVKAGGKLLTREQITWITTQTSHIATISKNAFDSFVGNVRIVAREIGPDGPSDWTKLDIAIDNPPLPTRPGRLVVFSCAVEDPPGRVAGSGRDVEELASFFNDRGHLISPGDGKPFRGGPDYRIFIRPKGAKKPGSGKKIRYEDPSVAEFSKDFDELARVLGMNGGSPPDNRGDVLLIHLEALSDFGTPDGDRILIGDEKQGGVTARFLEKRLKAIAETGCRVYVFLDIVHRETKDNAVKDARDQWIRQLLDDGVSCFVASKDRPSWLETGDVVPLPGGNGPFNGNRLFAASILKVLNENPRKMNFTEFVDQATSEAKSQVGEARFDPDFFNHWTSRLVNPLDPFIGFLPPKPEK